MSGSPAGTAASRSRPEWAMTPAASWPACVALLLAALPAAAQENGPPAADEGETTIVVTGKGEEDARREAYEQARDVSRVGRYQLYDETLPRFEAPLCPSVLGINADHA